MISLDIWPHLPLLIKGETNETGVDNVIACLKHSDRIRLIHLNCYPPEPSELEDLWTAMEVPFPELATLYLSCGLAPDVPVLPDSFLGGSAPRLRYFSLEGIPFLGLLKLVLFATHLVTLGLRNIPDSGYISPEAMAASLSMLTSLERFYFDFDSPQSFPVREI